MPQWEEYYAEEDVSIAFEGMITMEGQEHLLTVAPPMRLNADSFTEKNWDHMGWRKKRYKRRNSQMIGCCSGWECRKEWAER